MQRSPGVARSMNNTDIASSFDSCWLHQTSAGQAPNRLYEVSGQCWQARSNYPRWWCSGSLSDSQNPYLLAWSRSSVGRNAVHVRRSGGSTGANILVRYLWRHWSASITTQRFSHELVGDAALTRDIAHHARRSGITLTALLASVLCIFLPACTKARAKAVEPRPDICGRLTLDGPRSKMSPVTHDVKRYTKLPEYRWNTITSPL